ncbi:MAG TPA: hypothetical protein VFS17_02850 [Methylophilaceae bacterium]|nr:hypothetical protein [Methylophilaceae bacterium]
MEDLHHHILGIYDSKAEAQQTMSRLMELGLSGTQLNLIEPGSVPVGLPSVDAPVLTNLRRADLDHVRAFADLMKQALLSGQVVLMGHTTNQEQTTLAQGVINGSLTD